MRIGVFGGTFDPPHLGHLGAAGDAADALGLERVVWIPSAHHPFKGKSVRTPPALRLEMTRAAIAGDPRFEADDLELERQGPSYTVDTLRELYMIDRWGAGYFDVNEDGMVTVSEVRAFIEAKHGKGYEKSLLDKMEASTSGLSCATPFANRFY